ncbi:MAG: Rieske 2Fe-2S domain-containing protein, partial [Chloroflexi bacterium]|nr:Rieske 2Fe-2S domain-containing protein [Chloroflexota bacterium]
DGQGQLGLLGRWCSHRAADLSRGYREEEGLRCWYHGWLYDRAGRCLDQPLEPPDSTLKEAIQHRAYICQEKAGLIFAYLGSGDPPFLPNYDALTAPETHRRSAKYVQEFNYLQGNEGSIDPMQVWYMRRALGAEAGDAAYCPLDENDLTIEPEETDYGVRLSAVRTTGQVAIVDIRGFMLPNLCAVPGLDIDGHAIHWHVPIDDTHHWRYVVVFRRDGPITDDEARQNGVEAVPGYLLDRERVLHAIRSRDATEENVVVFATGLAEAQGPIYDRTQEHLGPADGGITVMRNVIHRAIQDVEEGTDPAHVVRSLEANHFPHLIARSDRLPAGEDWRTNQQT